MTTVGNDVQRHSQPRLKARNCTPAITLKRLRFLGNRGAGLLAESAKHTKKYRSARKTYTHHGFEAPSKDSKQYCRARRAPQTRSTPRTPARQGPGRRSSPRRARRAASACGPRACTARGAGPRRAGRPRRASTPRPGGARTSPRSPVQRIHEWSLHCSDSLKQCVGRCFGAVALKASAL